MMRTHDRFFPCFLTKTRQAYFLSLSLLMAGAISGLSFLALPAMAQINTDSPFTPYPSSYNQASPPAYNNNYNPYPNRYSSPPYPINYTNNAPSLNPLQGYVVSVPMGTPLQTTLSIPLSSEFARPGDRVTVTLAGPLSSGTGVVLPAGSQVEGQVVSATAAGRAGRNGELDLRFNSALLPSGQRVALSARVQTPDNTGLLKGATTLNRVGKVAGKAAVGAGLGALLGTALGPLSGGEVGRGAVYGTAVGAGAGLAKSVWDKGTEVQLGAGQPLTLILDQPLSVNPGGGY